MLRRLQETLTVLLSIAASLHAQNCPQSPTTAPGEYILNITADQTLFALYVDGVAYNGLPNYNNYAKVDTIELPTNARLLAVHGQHSLAHAGILASVSNNYFTTNAQLWKCTTYPSATPPEDWINVGFDDSDWPAAVEIGIHGDPGVDFDWGCITGISPYAYWLWTSSSVGPSEDRHIFCRGYPPLCEVLKPCQNGGTCSATGAQLCTCGPNYSGEFCETDMDPCRSNPCKNGATCISNPNQYQCVCPPNFTGTQCETYINVCDSNPCQNDGTCTDYGGSFQCTCKEFSTGVLCETYMNACESSPCKNSATCVNYGDYYVCVCKPFFTGPDCASEIPYDCGNILHNAANTTDIPAGWHLGCYIGEGDEAYWYTPCNALLQGLSYYENAENLLAAGGDFGCWAAPEKNEDLFNACFPSYQQELILGDCSVCNYLAVCVQFPPTGRSAPTKRQARHGYQAKRLARRGRH